MKYTSRLLSGVFLISLVLVGCGQKTPVETAPTQEPTPPAQVAPQAPTETTTKSVNLDTSVVKWTAKKVGGQHYGTVKLLTGSLDVDSANKVAGGSFTLDMQTITVDDLEGDMQTKLLEHLKSDDFFAVPTNPTATLKITAVKELNTNSFEISGELTIKGITNPIAFVATVDENNTFTAPIVIDRTLRDIKYNSLKFFSDIADKAIDDTITFDVTLNIQ